MWDTYLVSFYLTMIYLTKKMLMEIRIPIGVFLCLLGKTGLHFLFFCSNNKIVYLLIFWKSVIFLGISKVGVNKWRLTFYFFILKTGSKDVISSFSITHFLFYLFSTFSVLRSLLRPWKQNFTDPLNLLCSWVVKTNIGSRGRSSSMADKYHTGTHCLTTKETASTTSSIMG